MSHIIQTSAPSVPEGFTVVYHKDMGPFDIENLEQWLEENSDSSKLPWPYPKTCTDIRMWAEQATGVINACILDYALAHQELMPILWNLGNPVVAYGTIYADADGTLHVKVIEYRGGNVLHEGRMEPICGTEPIYESFFDLNGGMGFRPCWSKFEVSRRLVPGWGAKFCKPSTKHRGRCGIW
ncbi:MAG: hypothetical protein KBD27_01110 [Candidatus Moranbacteria bacterium]|nr:hypothetical protein [Candidatus Moranbacteria bacterium]